MHTQLHTHTHTLCKHTQIMFHITCTSELSSATLYLKSPSELLESTQTLAVRINAQMFAVIGKYPYEYVPKRLTVQINM